MKCRLATISIDAAYGIGTLADPVRREIGRVGRVTAGGYGRRVGKSLGLGFVRPEYAEPGTTLEIKILGERKPITIIPESPYDPQNETLRG